MPANSNFQTASGSVTALSDGSFCISGPTGDIRARVEEGLFYRDTRHLSKFILLVNGEAPGHVSSTVFEGGAEFHASAGVNGEPDGLSIVRRRTLEEVMREEIRLVNRTDAPVNAGIALDLDADFADLMHVRWGGPERPGEFIREVEDGSLRFAYRREDFRPGTRVIVDADAEALEPGRIVLKVSLAPDEERVVRVEIVPEEDGKPPPPLEPSTKTAAEIPVLETDCEQLARSWKQSMADLRSLRFRLGPDDPGEVLAAGVPWYMALFGRDSLIACYQTVSLFPELARNTLRSLARRQATDFDDFRDAEPGKILHELRFGELTRFGLEPNSPYYGTVDATPLFLILLHELWRWTADDALAREMENTARRALDWMESHADSNGDGYLDYERRSPKGLVNQGWKDSSDSMLFASGEQAEPPIAVCEAQGYAYDALIRTSELAEKVWEDDGLARKLTGQAEELRDRFNRDFWVPERGGYYALALDGAGRRVDSITSNMGHLLWSGIVPEEKSRIVAERLMSPEMFGGWGVRTMAEGEGGYDPLSYHNGSVWPHDNSLIALGLYRYGHHEEANRIATTMIEAAEHFDHRLPEVFAGHRREPGKPPEEYPTTCSPQAWAAGTVPLLARVLREHMKFPSNSL